MSTFQNVLVTGGAGYVGAVLVPKLIEKGYRVKVIDLYIYGQDVFLIMKGNPNLTEIKGDIRDRAILEREIPGTDAIIHLACISNDPCFELDPKLGKSINHDAFIPLLDIAKNNGIRRFIYASSSSVYGAKKESEVTEDLPLEPLTDYSRYKAVCEELLLKKRSQGFVALIIRPATVCGYSPRMRLDLTVNILVNHAVTNGLIKVFGGEQMRPNIHVEDMAALYVQALEWPDEKIDGQIYNAGHENYRVAELAKIVRRVVGRGMRIVTTPSEDQRSYHISSEKIKRELNFIPRSTVEDAVSDIVAAFRAGKIPHSMTDIRYYNIKTMQHLQLS